MTMTALFELFEPASAPSRSFGRRGLLWASELCVAVALAAASASPSLAADPSPSASNARIQAQYERERAKCLDGRSSEDKATCLKESGAAREAAMQGQLGNGDGTYGRNAMERCDALSGDQARDCMARVRGKGMVSGSVAGGGILRETVTEEVKPINSAASSPASH